MRGPFVRYIIRYISYDINKTYDKCFKSVAARSADVVRTTYVPVSKAESGSTPLLLPGPPKLRRSVTEGREVSGTSPGCPLAIRRAFVQRRSRRSAAERPGLGIDMKLLSKA